MCVEFAHGVPDACTDGLHLLSQLTLNNALNLFVLLLLVSEPILDIIDDRPIIRVKLASPLSAVWVVLIQTN